MAEIEFKRRGTPLWLVLLILLVVGAGAYFALGRRPDAAPAAATATDSTPAAAPTPGTAGLPPAPPPPTGPTAEFARFVDAGSFPASGAQAQRTYLSEGIRKMAGVLQERAPTAGVQMVLLRAVADTIAMPETKTERLADLTQLAMFAFGHALTAAKVDDGRLSTAAGHVAPGTPLSEQSRQVNEYLRAARDLLTKGANAPAAAPATRGAPAPAPRS